MKLYEGERLELSKFDKNQLNDCDLVDKYKSQYNMVLTDQARYPIDQVYQMFSNQEKFELNPDYQRGVVWDSVRRSKLIESLLMNIPIPPVFLYEVDYNKYEILDGKQRISAIVDFYDDKFSLEGLEVWSGLNDKKYSELPDVFKKGLERRYISSIIVMKESYFENDDKSLLRTIFERLNSGGIKLTEQESRNAIMSGPFNDMCKNVVRENRVFREIFNLKKTPTQLSFIENYNILDHDENNEIINYSEYVLRYFAYRQIDLMDCSLVKFLDTYLKYANTFTIGLINKLKENYDLILNFAYDLFDRKPFRTSHSGKPTYLVYDPLMQALAKYYDYRDILLTKKTIIQEKYYAIVSKKKYFNGKITHKSEVEKRITMLESLFEEVLNQ